MLTKLVATALISLSVGAAGTYATVHVTAICGTNEIQGRTAADARFLAAPPLPTTGYPRY
jgi:hypothetical protein